MNNHNRKIEGIPPLEHTQFRSYLEFYGKMKSTIKQERIINFTVFLGLSGKLEYEFSIDDLQKLAFEDVLTRLSKYTGKSIRENVYRKAFEGPNQANYFNELIDLIDIIEKVPIPHNENIDPNSFVHATVFTGSNQPGQKQR